MTSKSHPITAWCKLTSPRQVSLSAIVNNGLNIMVSAMAASGFIHVAVVFPIFIYRRAQQVFRLALSESSVSAITLTEEIYFFLFADTGSNPGVLVQTDIDNGLSKTLCLSLHCNC